MLDCPVTSILVTNTVIDITQQRACDIPTPRNVSEALAEKHAAQWLKSMAIDWACYTVNVWPCSANELNQSPYQMVLKKLPGLSKLRAFGCECTYTLTVDAEIAKGKRFSARGAKAMFLGHARGHKNVYIVQNNMTKSVLIRRDVKIDETKLDQKIRIKEITYNSAIDTEGETVTFVPKQKHKPSRKVKWRE